jgi:hypothetical protein
VYDEKFLFTGDHEFFLRVLLKSKFNCFFVHSDVIAIHYRDGISNSQENFNKIILERDKSLQANLHDDFLFQATKFYLEFRSIKGFLYLLKSIWIRINFK